MFQYVSRRPRTVSRKAQDVERRLARTDLYRNDEESKDEDDEQAHPERIIQSADELGEILEKGTKDDATRKRTENLMHLISSEINRILQYDEFASIVESVGPPEVPTESNTNGSTPQSERIQGEGEPREEQDIAKRIDDIIETIGKSHPIVVSPTAQNRTASDSSLAESKNSNDDSDELESLLSFLTSNEENKVHDTEDFETASIESISHQLTPFEVWKKSRRSEETERKPVKELNESEWAVVVERLNKYQREKEEAMMKAQFNVLSEELSSLRFHPEINTNSRKMARVKPLAERMDSILEERDRKLQKERERLVREEIASCPGVPKINKTKRWKGKVAKKFLSANLEHMKEEEYELTFSPKLNKKSAEMAKHATMRGTRIHVTDSTKKSTKRQCPPPKPSFQPKINARSRKLDRDSSEPVHERLYRMKAPAQSSNTNKGKKATCVVRFDPEKHGFLLKLHPKAGGAVKQTESST